MIVICPHCEEERGLTAPFDDLGQVHLPCTECFIAIHGKFPRTRSQFVDRSHLKCIRDLRALHGLAVAP